MPNSPEAHQNRANQLDDGHAEVTGMPPLKARAVPDRRLGEKYPVEGMEVGEGAAADATL